ncbi:MAG: protein kinase [Blastocatellia bacterium]
MTPERYQQIGSLYHDALELARPEREGFLARVCAGDDELRREVESLIASHDQAADFIALPPVEIASEMIAEKQARRMTGRRLGHYEVLSLLGAGGMGEVYRARDTRLGREVAIKVLPPHLAGNPEAMKRFEREARTVAALSHPNILAIHDFGVDRGVSYAVMELLRGETLRDSLTRDTPDWRRAVKIALGIAHGLEAAHSRGIIHRDLKPENIFLTTEGQVKILDFGIAKLNEVRNSEFGIRNEEEKVTLLPAGAGIPHSALRIPHFTTSGLVMGTPAYMSPEQVRGETVDAPGDIFSFGSLLYEMLTGRRPFAGSDTAETIAAILKDDPPALAASAPDIPVRLEEIVRRCLAKRPQDRCQSARELITELQAVLHDDALLLRSNELPVRLQHSGHELFSGIVQRQKNPLLNLTVLIAAVLIASFGLSAFFWSPPKATPFQNVRVAKLTTNGTATAAAISPDGRYVVYAISEGSGESLWLRQVAAAGNVRLLPPSQVAHWGLTFSPDGNYVWFNQSDSAETSLWRVPTLGGAANKVLEFGNNMVSPVRFSPDGRKIAWMRGSLIQRETVLMIANVDGSGEEMLALRTLSKGFGIPAWSPDGQLIACGAVVSDQQGIYSSVLVISLADRSERLVSSERWQEITELDWMADGHGMIMTARGQDASFIQLWHLSWPDGKAQHITSDLSDYLSVSLAADARSLVTVQRQRLSNIRLSSVNGHQDTVQITSGAGRYFDLAQAPDGSIVYASDASGSADIWQMQADGSGQRQLTSGAGRNYGPVVSPDGRYIVFHSNRDGAWNIWRMDRDGGNLKQLTTGREHCNFPQITPDGKWVIYHHYDEFPMLSVWKVSIDGGQPVRLTDKPAVRPAVSPDGKFIACLYLDLEKGQVPHIAVIPIDGGPPVKLFDLPPTAKINDIQGVVWMPDGRALSYVNSRNGVDNIWRLPLDGRKPEQLTDFKSDQIESFLWARDGRLICSQGVITGEVLLFSDTR